MNISCNWVRELLPGAPEPERIAEILTRIGHEVDGAQKVGHDLAGVVIGRVEQVAPHPDADRLRVCRVTLDGKDAHTIVCGAPNVAEGQYVAVATVGTELPIEGRDGKPLVIRESKIRGVASSGMICAEDELGLGDDHAGILVLDPAGAEPLLGRPLRELFPWMQPDTVLDVSLTPNRPDAASHIGIARDLACALDLPFRDPVRETSPGAPQAGGITAGAHAGGVKIEIVDENRCPRYAALVIRGVRVGESPGWLKARLRALGLRAVNNIVDITNYILHETGQPLHAFDHAKLNTGVVRVRTFDEVTSFTTLDHTERKLPAGSLFICDSDRPIALAGVMGGLDSEVDESTRDVLLESACFEASGIRRTSRAAALQTDASYRYERGSDPGICMAAARRAAQMMVEIAGGSMDDAQADVWGRRPEPVRIPFRPERVARILGGEFQHDRMAGILESLGIRCDRSDPSFWLCQSPSFRPDLLREIDLVEEIGRISDYNLLPAPETQPAFTPSPLPSWISFTDRVRSAGIALGYREIVTNSLLPHLTAVRFAAESSLLQTLNPVSQDATTLRTNLLAGFLNAARFNLNRDANGVRFFEIGHVYERAEEGSQGDWIEGILEHVHLHLGLCGTLAEADWSHSESMADFPKLKSDLIALFESLGLDSKQLRQEIQVDSSSGSACLELRIGRRLVGWIQELPASLTRSYDLPAQTASATLDLSVLHEIHDTRGAGRIRFEAPSKFPAFEYDAAFVVDKGVAGGDLAAEIRRAGGRMLHDLELFDVFEGESVGEGKKSLAFRLTFLDRDKTLSSKQVEPVVGKIVQALNRAFDASLRS